MSNSKPKIKKVYVNSQELLLDSYKLAQMVLKDDKFKPTWILAIWRGGCFIGMAVQEYLAVHGNSTNHIAIRTSHYDSGIDKKKKKKDIRVHGLQYFCQACNYEDSLLIVDDVFDTGRSVEKLLQQIRTKMRRNAPKNIRTAVVWYKPKRNLTSIVPDYYLKEGDDWIVFPHELEGLTLEEIREKEDGKGKEIVETMDISLIPKEMKGEETEGEKE